MPAFLVARSRCPYHVGSATMRASISPFLCPFRHSTISHRIVKAAPPLRKLYSTSSRRKDSRVFPNDLRKTLAAHRISNRVSVVRKVAQSSPHEPSEVARPPQKTSHESSEKQSLSKAPPEATASLEQPDEHARRRSSKKPTSSKRQNRASPATPPSAIASPAGAEEPELSLDESCPWLGHMNSEVKSSDAITRLDAEIKALARYMTPTRRERAAVDNVISDVTGLVAGIARRPAQVVGSWRTGFSSSHSNLNLLLPEGPREPADISSKQPEEVIDQHMEPLRKISAALQESPDFTAVDIISRGIPVITAVHQSTDLQIQFHCGRGRLPLIEYIRNYHDEYPALRPLYMATRVILESRGMFGADASSIDSTALIMLIAAFLKMHHGQFQRPDSLSAQLLGFLQYFSTGVNLRSTGISIDPPGTFTLDALKDDELLYGSNMPALLRGQLSLMNVKRTATRKHNKPLAGRLCIQDPSNYMRDLGGWCTRTSHLQRGFGSAHYQLKNSLKNWRMPGRKATPSVLQPALRQQFFEEFHKKRLRLAFSSD